MKSFSFLLLAALIASCATITTGSKQDIEISTKPIGAQCKIYRQGEVIAEVDQTPGKVSLSKSDLSLAVICKKEGYIDNSGIIASHIQNMTWGNIILGGLIGFAIDAGTGSTQQYESGINIQLIPAYFLSAIERDTFFDSLKNKVLQEYDSVIKSVSENCEEKKACDNTVIAAKMLKKNKLSKIEKQRRYAIIKDY